MTAYFGCIPYKLGILFILEFGVGNAILGNWDKFISHWRIHI